ncbi:probable E3 ubiquitin-protein ligase RHY1A [Aristolochia californica]|uniref:probable E3 ubiquitin-protein ligase RHY1A n=1 Tax=Aristolochia californica TaxID=171875 RepID=UPI0035D9DDFD
MAGMLPGVECARRRRFHQGGSMDTMSGVAKSCTRRSSFCLYASNHEAHLSANSLQRSVSSQELHTQKLGYAAREARERLDERLRSQRKPQPTRCNSAGAIKSVDNSGAVSNLQKLLGTKKKRWSIFCWGKLRRDGLKQEECAVCLEGFKPQELLVDLPCYHRFHSRCLVPWIEENTNCPYCRRGIFS